MSVNERPDKPCVTVIMRNTGHNKNKRITMHEASMWTSKTLPGTKWHTKKNRYGISGYVHISTGPWVLMQWKAWFIGVCSRRKWESQHRRLIYITSCGSKGTGRTKKGRGRRLIHILSSHSKMGIRKKYVKIRHMRGTWDTYTTTLCLCLLVKFYMWSLKNTLVLCRNIRIHLLYTYSMLEDWYRVLHKLGQRSTSAMSVLRTG